MKKMVSILVMAAVLLCAGCSGGQGSDRSGSESATSSNAVVSDSSATGTGEEPADVSGTGESSVSLAGMLPDASAVFSDASFNVISDGETMYCFMVDGYKDGEYDKYVEECKKTFPDVKFDIYTDSNNKFEAKTEDGKYYVSVQLIFDQNAFTVTCGVSRS